MPRTKNVRKSKQEQKSTEESNLLVTDFERQAHLRILKMEAETKMAIKSLETYVDVTLARLPPEIRHMTLGEILSYEDDNQKENHVSSSVDDCFSPLASATLKGKKNAKRITAASDDGYVTEGVAATRPSRASKKIVESTTNRRTRSTSRNSRMQLTEINLVTVKKNKRERGKESMKADTFKTPAYLEPLRHEYDLVTPKIKPNTALNVLRRPRKGEMVLSMQGSPLLVSAVIQDDTANINVPLRNGNIISLLPNDELRMSNIPTLDSETMRQLETLKSHIEKVILTK